MTINIDKLEELAKRRLMTGADDTLVLIARLREVEAERDALSAHVENARLLAARVGDGHDPDSPEWEVAISEALSALDDAPTTSLARLKAQWCDDHAERFMEMADNARDNGYMAQADAVEDMAQELRDEAAELRRQAEEAS